MCHRAPPRRGPFSESADACHEHRVVRSLVGACEHEAFHPRAPPTLETIMATKTRALPVAAAILVFLGAGQPLLAQNAEADAVKRVIREETESYYRRDADAWKGTWVQD